MDLLIIIILTVFLAASVFINYRQGCVIRSVTVKFRTQRSRAQQWLNRLHEAQSTIASLTNPMNKNSFAIRNVASNTYEVYMVAHYDGENFYDAYNDSKYHPEMWMPIPAIPQLNPEK